MDNITHFVTGLLLSRAGLNRVTPSATWVLLVAANLPDADIVSLLGGSANYLHWHRHLTHSLLAAPLLALALAAAFRGWRSTDRLWPVFWVALCGIASHLLLDLTNVYGVRLLLPFRSTWFHWDLTPVVDYWIWLFLALATALPYLARLVGSEIGERRSARPGSGFAIFGLLCLIAYNGGRAVLHSRAVSMLETRTYNGTAPLRVAAFPASMNPLLWRGLAETAGDYQVFEIDAARQFHPDDAQIVAKALPSAALASASATDAFRVMSEFAQFPIYRVVPRPLPEGGTQIEFSDLRFGFTSVALVNRANQVESSSFQFGPVALR